jgi:hypothetical protein
MANTRTANVIFVDTTAATYTGPIKICGIKYIGNTSGTLQIQSQNVSGAVLWEARGTADSFDEAEIFASDGIYVALTNGAKAYIYLEV